MPNGIILKLTPESDLYCLWSTIVDYWTFLGTRAEVERQIESKVGTPLHKLTTATRFARADKTGSSAEYDFGRWGDELTVDHSDYPLGTIDRDRLLEFISANDAQRIQMITPWEDS